METENITDNAHNRPARSSEQKKRAYANLSVSSGEPDALTSVNSWRR